MRIFAIRDDRVSSKKDLGYLFYYERADSFMIELPSDADELETPLILSSLVKRKIFTVNEEISRLWIRQRIVPLDRQNLGAVLKACNLKEYDEFKLLMLHDGRCEQDECYLKEIRSDALPDEIRDRIMNHHISGLINLGEDRVLVTFSDDKARICRLKRYADFFRGSNVSISPGGRFLSNGAGRYVSAEKIEEDGEVLPVSVSDIQHISAASLVTTEAAREIMGCTRQNLDDMVKKGKLHPVDMVSRSNIYSQCEITEAAWG